MVRWKCFYLNKLDFEIFEERNIVCALQGPLSSHQFSFIWIHAKKKEKAQKLAIVLDSSVNTLSIVPNTEITVFSSQYNSQHFLCQVHCLVVSCVHFSARSRDLCHLNSIYVRMMMIYIVRVPLILSLLVFAIPNIWNSKQLWPRRRRRSETFLSDFLISSFALELKISFFFVGPMPRKLCNIIVMTRRRLKFVRADSNFISITIH